MYDDNYIWDFFLLFKRINNVTGKINRLTADDPIYVYNLTLLLPGGFPEFEYIYQLMNWILTDITKFDIKLIIKKNVEIS